MVNALLGGQTLINRSLTFAGHHFVVSHQTINMSTTGYVKWVPNQAALKSFFDQVIRGTKSIAPSIDATPLSHGKAVNNQRPAPIPRVNVSAPTTSDVIQATAHALMAKPRKRIKRQPPKKRVSSKKRARQSTSRRAVTRHKKTSKKYKLKRGSKKKGKRAGFTLEPKLSTTRFDHG